jgi:hypothetical protein
MADLTTAQRLAAYRDELQAAGFSPAEAAEIVQSAAPSLVEDVDVQADLDDTGAVIGEVRVRMVPHHNEDDLRQIAEHVHATVNKAANGER